MISWIPIRQWMNERWHKLTTMVGLSSILRQLERLPQPYCNRGSMITVAGLKVSFTISDFVHLWRQRYGVSFRLKLAWEKGTQQAILEVDSKFVAAALSQEDLARVAPWSLVVQCTNCEGNSCANWMTNQALFADFGFHVASTIPSRLKSFIYADKYLT